MTVDIEVNSAPVVATTRKLKAKWSFEMARDMEVYFSKTYKPLRKQGPTVIPI